MGIVKVVVSLNNQGLFQGYILACDSSFSFITWSLRRVGKATWYFDFCGLKKKKTAIIAQAKRNATPARSACVPPQSTTLPTSALGWLFSLWTHLHVFLFTPFNHSVLTQDAPHAQFLNSLVSLVSLLRSTLFGAFQHINSTFLSDSEFSP